MKIEIDFEHLECYSYLDLRRIGKWIGVKSPTSKNKPQLAEEIRMIHEGKMEPVKKPKKKKMRLKLTQPLPEEGAAFAPPKNTEDIIGQTADALLRCIAEISREQTWEDTLRYCRERIEKGLPFPREERGS